MTPTADSNIDSLLKRLRQEAKHAVVGKCSEQGCSLRIDPKTKCLILKGETLCDIPHKASDCIIFVAGVDCLVVCITELKNKTIHARDVIEKLRNSTDEVLELINRCEGKNAKCDFYHLVLARRWYPSEYKMLTRDAIKKINGKPCYALPKACGERLSIIFKQNT